jgi:hypothetical protein
LCFIALFFINHIYIILACFFGDSRVSIRTSQGNRGASLDSSCTLWQDQGAQLISMAQLQDQTPDAALYDAKRAALV